MARPVSGSRSRVGVLAVKQDVHNTTLGVLRDPGREYNVLLAHFRALQCVTLEATAITSITAPFWPSSITSTGHELASPNENT